MINIGVLVENSAISNWHGREHGLSLHIKTIIIICCLILDKAEFLFIMPGLWG